MNKGRAAHLNRDTELELPVAISFIGGRYLLFDVKAVSFLRKEHQLCGTMIGTLPQSPSQNLFLGLPIEIMPEEAQLLVEKKIGFILDDARAHDQALFDKDAARREEFLERVEKQTREVKILKDKEQAEAKRRALSKRSSTSGTPRAGETSTANSLLDFEDGDESNAITEDTISNTESIIDESPVKLMTNTTISHAYYITPTTSRLLLPPFSSNFLPGKLNSHVPSSYALYKHLNQKGFFVTPGLRFGCQYTVYPGDPLRFHSHYLAVGREWDEEIDLMNIVSGGRLGTGVKKSFLIGGEDPTGKLRSFSVEWAAM